jgi:hypothetical protein
MSGARPAGFLPWFLNTSEFGPNASLPTLSFPMLALLALALAAMGWLVSRR